MTDSEDREELLRLTVATGLWPWAVVSITHSQGSRSGNRYELTRTGGPWGMEDRPFSIHQSLVSDLLAELETLQISPIPKFAMGLDGTTYTLEVTRGFNTTRLEWWGSLPVAWSGLGPILSRLLTLAEFDLKESSVWAFRI